MLRIALLNHLLAERTELRAELSRHAGRVASIAMPPFKLTFLVGQDGLLASSREAPAATLRIAAWLLPRLAMGDVSAQREVKLEGDAAFAADLAKMLQALDWDAERDLARVTGDIAAHRIANTAQRLIGDPRVIVSNLAQTSTEYLQEEAGVLVTTPSLNLFNSEVDELRDAVARLEKRLLLLEEAAKPSAEAS